MSFGGFGGAMICSMKRDGVGGSGDWMKKMGGKRGSSRYATPARGVI